MASCAGVPAFTRFVTVDELLAVLRKGRIALQPYRRLLGASTRSPPLRNDGNAMNPDEVKAKLAAGQAATIASLRGLARGVARSHRPLPQRGPGAGSAFGS